MCDRRWSMSSIDRCRPCRATEAPAWRRWPRWAQTSGPRLRAPSAFPAAASDNSADRKCLVDRLGRWMALRRSAHMQRVLADRGGQEDLCEQDSCNRHCATYHNVALTEHVRCLSGELRRVWHRLIRPVPALAQGPAASTSSARRLISIPFLSAERRSYRSSHG